MQEQNVRPTAPAEPEEAEIPRAAEGRFREFIAEQNWLEPVASRVQEVAGSVMTALGTPVVDFLHGTWMGHPLHPALTDVVLGAWTAGIIMDVVDLGEEQPKLAKGADAAIAVGVASAIPTAAAGMADWRHTYGFPRRVGLVHATLNATALLLNATSLVLRARGQRRQGVLLSSLGYLSTFLGAWLGGELVYEEGIGVDHTAFEEGPRNFVPVMAERDLQEGRLTRVQANGVPVLLFRHGSRITAMAETCSHQGGPLSEGRVEDDTVICPWHGSRYRLEDGKLVHGPSTYDQPCYDVRVRDGQIEVREAPHPG